MILSTRRGALHARLEAFALSLHPDKTRLIKFGRHAAERRKRRGLGRPETFDFLGFTMICGRSRKGKFLPLAEIPARPAADEAYGGDGGTAAAETPADPSSGEVAAPSCHRVAYHAAPTNIRALQTFRDCVTKLWLRSLRRRGQRDRMTWERIKRLADDYLPKPRILHPWPEQRFAVRHPRWEPYAGMLHVRVLCGGRAVMRVPTAIQFLFDPTNSVGFAHWSRLWGAVLTLRRARVRSPAGIRRPANVRVKDLAGGIAL